MNDAAAQILLLAAAPVITIIGATWALRGYISKCDRQMTIALAVIKTDLAIISIKIDGQKAELERVEKDRKECTTRHDRDLLYIPSSR